jgi:hypothetical protein
MVYVLLGCSPSESVMVDEVSGFSSLVRPAEPKEG